jgi:membrane protease YdiL (CAAX protease family)
MIASLDEWACGGALVLTPLLFIEEFGWRGYLQVRVCADRPIMAAVVTGIIWGVFHYPLILLGFEGYENTALGLIVFPVFTVLMSIILGWLRQRTGSIWAGCLAHSASDMTGSLCAYFFYGGGQWILTSYAGVLAWIPLGVVCIWIVLTSSRIAGRD